MHLQKGACQWWASLQIQGTASRTWTKSKSRFMEHFLTDQACDNSLATWRSLKMEQGEFMQKYVDTFWDAKLKASIYKTKIGFTEQK